MRDHRWIWEYFVNRGENLPSIDSIGVANRLKYLIETIEPNTHTNGGVDWDNLIQRKQDALLDAEAFKWLQEKNNERMLIWVSNETYRRLSTGGYRSNRHLPHLNTADQIIFRIDIWNASLAEKAIFLEDLRKDWSRSRTPDSDTRWIDSSNDKQLAWAWDYLRKQKYDVSVSPPVTRYESYNAILASLDNMSSLHPDTKKLNLDKMRRTWSQKKYRDSGNSRNQVYLPLNKSARESMQWLAEQLNKRPHIIVEELIEAEFHRVKSASK